MKEKKAGLEVLTKAEMPDGTHIQLERWGRSDGSSELEIGCYPICQVQTNIWQKKGERFRLTLTRIPQNEVHQLYMDLRDGVKTLEECEKHFYYGEADAEKLGIKHKLTLNEIRRYWEKKAMYIIHGDGSNSMCQDNGYTLEEILQEVQDGAVVYLD